SLPCLKREPQPDDGQHLSPGLSRRRGRGEGRGLSSHRSCQGEADRSGRGPV
ncbi:uncharacterized protein METZ01_LOCUS386778, partial [marine metagenome]